MSARTRQRIALITDGLIEGYQIEVRKAFERAALSQGFDLVVAVGRSLAPAAPGERPPHVVYDWISKESVDGVVLLTGVLINFLGQASLEALVARLGNLPKVSIGVELPNVPSATIDNRAGMRAAVEHLIRAHRCHAIAYLGGPSNNQEARARVEGYRSALEAQFVAFDQRFVEHGPFTLEGGRDCMRVLLGRGIKFDAVVAANDAIAVGARLVLEANGLKVPEQVRLIGFDDSALAASSLLSSVAQPFNQLALHALKALIDAMQGRSARQVAFCPRLALRDSCGCSDTAQKLHWVTLHSGKKVRRVPATHNSSFIDVIQDATAASFDWWSQRAESLRPALRSALIGDAQDLLLALDELAGEAFAQGVPLEQIERNVSLLQAHLDGAQTIDARQGGVEVWTRAKERVSATLGQLVTQNRVEAFSRSVAVRKAILRLSDAQDERELASHLARELPILGVQRAYVGLMDTTRPGRFEPLLQLDAYGAVRLEGPAHDMRQLLPAGFPEGELPSTLLVAALNFDAKVIGVWACDGQVDALVFEQLRVEIGAIIELSRYRRGLERASAARQPALADADRPQPEPRPAPPDA